MTKEDLGSNMNFLLDDVRKKLGNSRQFVEDKVAEMYAELAGAENKFMKEMADFKKEAQDFSAELNQVSERSFQGLNLAKKVESDFRMVDKIEEKHEELKKNLELFSEDIKNKVEKIESEISLHFKSFSNDFAICKKQVEELSLADILFKENFDKMNNRVNTAETRIDGTEKSSIHQLNFMSEAGEDIKSIKYEMDKMYNQLQDICRDYKSYRIFQTEEISKLKEKLIVFADKDFVKDVDKKFKLALEEVEKKIPAKEADQNLPLWKEQIEMKISRLENKMN